MNFDEIKSVDCETFDPHLTELGPGIYRKDSYVLGVSIAQRGRPSKYYNLGHKNVTAYEREKNLRILKDELGDDTPKLGVNFGYDVDYLENQLGLKVGGTWHDIQVAEPLLDAYKFSYSLDTLAKQYLNREKEKSSLQDLCDARGLKGDFRKHLYLFSSEQVAPYAIGDVELPLLIFERQYKEMESQGLLALYETECDVLKVLNKMRKNGIRIDRNKQETLAQKLSGDVKQLESELFSSYGTFNYNSTKQLADIFEGLGISYSKTEKGNPSIKNEDLLRIDHPIAHKLKYLREMDKVLNTFVLGAFAEYATLGRIHGQFLSMRRDEGGTVTGRLSMQNPNLQQVPHKKDKKDVAEMGFGLDFGNACRELFIPEDGCWYGKIDYEQIEYRIIAHYATGPRSDYIQERYRTDPNTDYHQLIMDWTGVDRFTAKRLNFGMAYGMRKNSMSKKFAWEVGYAERLINKYNQEVPFLTPTRELVERTAVKRGFVRTILNRRARLNPEQNKLLEEFREEWLKQNGNRQATEFVPSKNQMFSLKAYPLFNYLIQGSAADLMKQAMVNADKAGLFDVLTVHLTVHDELGVSIPKTKIGIEAYRELKHTMETAVQLKIPVIAGAEIGSSWGGCDEIGLDESDSKVTFKKLLEQVA